MKKSEAFFLLMNKLISALLILLFLPVTFATADVLVIVNESVPMNSMSRNTLTEIYQNQKTQWEDGSTIKIVLQVTGGTHKEFANEIINVSPSKLRRIWRQVIFTGTGNLPKLINEQENILKYVSNTKGAIGYIDAGIPHENVKVLTIK